MIRAGIATRDMLIAGYAEHKGVPGLFGFSVQYHPGATVDELARAAQFPNAQISFAPDTALGAALAVRGFRMRLVPSPGGGYHHTFCVLYDASGTMRAVRCSSTYYKTLPTRSLGCLLVFPIPIGPIVPDTESGA